MAKTFLLIGRSGVGKSYSMHTLDPQHYALISALGKELPFKTNKKFLETDNYDVIKDAILQYVNKGVKNIIIDDAGYLLTVAFMKAQGAEKKGNKVFDLYSEMATDFWSLVRFAQKQIPADVIIGFIMHEDKNEFGDITVKTQGRMLDERVNIAGMFTTLLQAVKIQGNYVFKTQTDGSGVTKSPFGMFDSEEIPNDMNYVIERIRAYYEI